MYYKVETLLLGTVVTIISLWLGSVEIRMRNLSDKPSRKEVTEEIILRNEALKLLQQEIKEDIRDIKRVLEKLSR